MTSRPTLRRLLAAVTLASAAALTGCGSEGSDNNATSVDGKAATADAKGKKFVYISGVNDAAYNAVYCGVQQAAQRLGVQVRKQDPTEFSPAAQTRAVNAVIASKPAGIVISPNDANAMLAPLQRAKAQGIKVVTALNTLNDPAPLASSSVFDEEAGGKAAADYLGKASQGKKVKVALITFKPKASLPADTRWRAFEDRIKTFPNIDYLGAEFVQEVAPSAATPVMNAILSRHPDVWGVDVTFGVAGQGAAAAIDQRGKDVKLTTYDPGNPGVAKALRSGTITAAVGYGTRKLGVSALEQAYNAVSGKPVTKRITFPPVVFTKQTATPQAINATESPDC